MAILIESQTIVSSGRVPTIKYSNNIVDENTKSVNISINASQIGEGCSINVSNYLLSHDADKNQSKIPQNFVFTEETQKVHSVQEFLKIFSNFYC